MARPRSIALALALLALLAYLPVTQYGFTSFDDDDCVTANEHVRGGLTGANVQWAFTTGRTGNWMPLTWLSHMAVCQVFGLHAWAHHLVNVLFHAANTALLFLLLCRWGIARWPAVFAVLLFALHPLHVESVAWVTERKDMLSTFFGLAALLAYTRHVRSVTGGTAKNPGPAVKLWTRDYVLTLLFFAGSLMSKPMLVTLPCVLLLVDLWPLGRAPFWPVSVAVWKKLVGEKIPLFVIAAGFCVITFLAQRAEGLVNSLAVIPLGDRLGNVPLAYVRYLFQWFWPVDLAAFYPFPYQISPVAIAGCLLLLGLISAVVWRERNRSPWWLFGWLWFLGTLVPVIGLVSFGGQAMANRFMYFPSIGLLLALALAFQGIIQHRKTWAAAVVSVQLGLVAACLGLTLKQAACWKDDIALFSRVIEVSRESRWFKLRDLGIVHYHLATALNKAGKKEEAISQYRAALALRPYYVQANDELGTLLLDVGQANEAIECFTRALQAEPNHPELACKLGLALASVGRLEEALQQYDRALQLKPDMAEAWFNRGLALAGKGLAPSAIAAYEEALRLRPDYVEVHNNLGITLARLGRLEEAIQHYQQAIQIKPNHAEAYNNLGIALASQGKWAEAVQSYEQALKIRPTYAKALVSLGLALVAQGKSEEGRQQMERAAALAAAQGNAPLAESIRARIRNLPPQSTPPPAP